jgi:hypothetical protein
MNYFEETENEISRVNNSNEEFSDPYIINVLNNSSQDKLVTIFNANSQLQELNNTLADGILGFVGNIFINNLVFFAQTNGKQSFTIDDGANFFLIVWNGVDAWDLLDDQHPIPNTLLQLYKDTALPIGGIGEWTVVTPSAFDTFNTKREVQATSLIPGVTYEQILQQSTVEPFKVGKTQVYSSSNEQLLEPYTRVEKDVNGNLVEFPFVPTIDPYQNNSLSIEFFDEYTIDGSVGLQFVARANSSCRFVFYPNKIYKAKDLLTSNNETEEYTIEKNDLEELVLSDKETYQNFTSSKQEAQKAFNFKSLFLTSSIIVGLIYIWKKWD